MAGIGFELKKLFHGKSIISKVRAYGYTGMITTGPMFLGILLLLVISMTGRHFGIAESEANLFVTMITYGLLFSILLSSVFSMINTRYLADMLYEVLSREILSSFYGTLCILLPAGCILYGIFLCFSGVGLFRILLNLMLFLILLAVWTATNYLTAIKNYKGILLGYVAAIVCAFSASYLLSFFLGTSLEILLGSCVIGYGVMMISDIILMHQFFPGDGRKPFLFLKWFDHYKELAWNGILMNVGLYSHLIITWHSRIGERMKGLFYAAPDYDVPAMFAFLTILITTVNFVVSTEVHFYPVYRKYYDLFNGTGSIDEIERAENQMMSVLGSELSYVARMQFSVTVLMVSIGPMILNLLPLGFTNLMGGYFRILCVGYGAYAVGNVLMMILMYFADDHGAMISSAIFAVVTTGGTLLTLALPSKYYGFAFAAGSIVYLFYCWHRLAEYTRHLGYYVLSIQPIVEEPDSGFFSKLEEKLDRNAEKKEADSV